MTAIRGYGLAALFVLAAGAISWLINPWIAPQAKSPYFAAVLLSAVIGVTGPGLFATVFASLAIAWFELGSERGLDGIDPDLLPHIFERFSQGTSGHKGGLGLGLTIVRHIIELHGGQVTATSKGRGRGARFAVRVPLAKNQKK